MNKLVIVGKRLMQDADVLRFLDREGYEPVGATTRAEGLAALHAAQANVVIIEHEAGDRSALELLGEVRATRPGCEVILVTPGGQIDVAIASLRAGALDYLKLPVDLEQLRVALGRARERRQRQLAAEPANILLLDDHEPTRKRLTQVLEKEGYRVSAGADGEEGERLLQQMRPDLVLADMRMPHKDGLTLLHETKRAGVDVEFIVMTGHGDEESVVQALRDGAANFLRKPVDLEQLLLAIEKALEHQTIRRSLAYRNRELELMQELVVRLTQTQEIIVEAPSSVQGGKTIAFLQRLVNSLPLAIVVVGADGELVFANSHVVEKTGKTPKRLNNEWLGLVGINNVAESKIDEVFQRALGNRLGTVETLMVTEWSFLVMTPLTLMGPEGAEHFVAVVIRGERKMGAA